MTFRNGFYAGLILVAAWGVYAAFLWQAERQVKLHTVHLLEQIEDHDWTAVGEFIDKNYQDRWGQDRARVLERLREVFRVLPNARLEVTSPSIRMDEVRGFWTARVTVKAAGGEFADYIKDRVNSLDAPFELEWKRGAWPWNWTLLTVRNSALEIPE